MLRKRACHDSRAGDMETRTVWVRICQECGYRNIGKPPNKNKELTDAYRNRPCKKCGSAGLDYGREEHIKVMI